jgi:oligoendopeptidase F
MRRIPATIQVAALLVASMAVAEPAPTPKGPAKMAAQQTPERKDIPAKYKWSIKDIFPTDAAWEKERKGLVGSFPGISRCKGKLSQGKKMVKTCLDAVFGARKRLARLGSYAHRKYDEDTRVANYQGKREVVEKLGTEFMAITAFIQPELLALPAAKLRALIADKDLKDYDQYLRDLLREKPHILSQSEEELLANASLMRDTGLTVYSAFTTADLKFPVIKDEAGKPVQLTQSLFTKYRASPDREVRKRAFQVFFSTFRDYRNTLASLLGAQVNANIVYAKARKYKSALEAALDANNIPVSVYKNMIKAINKHLPSLHRYLRLRQKLLGLTELRYFDLYPPMIAKVDLKFPYEQAEGLLAKAMSPLGKDYVATLSKALKPGSGWIDVFPNQGKKSGAYMDPSAFDVHPFVLTNYLGEYNSLGTVAHEMGHAMHSFLTNQVQPYAKSEHAIFVAEVASTLNEALLMREMLRTTKDPKKRLFLLGEQLENFRQTLFRQSMFAEFELAVYERAEKKEPLTAEFISQTYLDLLRRYYGHAKGLVKVDDLYGVEWGYVPHFYYGYYVFQYVTGITAATALSEQISKDGNPAAQRYIDNLLKAGSSDYPIPMLKRAGVDLTSVKPYDVAMAVFDRALAEAEKLTGK